MDEMVSQELIGIRMFKPYAKSDKAYASKYYCHKDVDCPLKDDGECLNATFLKTCVYGYVNRVTGWTQRARKYHAFVREWTQKAKDKPIKGPKRNGITFIDDYVWLPYSHMNHVDGRDR